VYTSTQSCPQSYKFTGYERDAETGLDYAFARYYNARLGRFMSGDPLASDVGDPQSLNRYAYARNNPINFIDPTGLQCDPAGHDSRGVPILSCNWPPERNLTPPGPAWYVPPYEDVPRRDDLYGGAPKGSFRPNQKPKTLTTKESYANCVKNDGDYFSLANGLSALTGGRLGNGFLANAFLGNTVSDVIQLAQDVRSLNGKGAIKNILGLGAETIASRVAKNIPNIAFSISAIASFEAISPTAHISGALGIEVSGSILTGTLARTGAGFLGAFGRLVTLPVSGAVSSFSAVVCGIGR
jgi:RHS repeat-associated protein